MIHRFRSVRDSRFNTRFRRGGVRVSDSNEIQEFLATWERFIDLSEQVFPQLKEMVQEFDNRSYKAKNMIEVGDFIRYARGLGSMLGNSGCVCNRKYFNDAKEGIEYLTSKGL